MRHTDIKPGDTLKLRADNPYGMGSLTLTVTDLRYRPGYKVPFVIVSGVGAFKPSDFKGYAS